MFSYRLFSYFCILLISSEMTLGQNNKKCAEFNEYCQNHWDCCSNSCMSYKYRCTRGYNVNPIPYSEALNKPTVTLEDLLEMNFGQANIVKDDLERKPYTAERFKDDDTINEIQIVLQNSDGTTEATTTHRQDTNILLFTTRIGENEPVIKETAGVEANLHTSGDQEKLTTDSQLINSEETCKEIGLKCYTNDECCTKRCHGFLHQCVT